MKKQDGETLELWRCSPLRALIPEAQCERNKARASLPEKSVVGMDGYKLNRTAAAILLGLGACVSCPGVRGLSKRPAKVVKKITVPVSVDSSKKRKKRIRPRSDFVKGELRISPDMLNG